MNTGFKENDSPTDSLFEEDWSENYQELREKFKDHSDPDKRLIWIRYHELMRGHVLKFLSKAGVLDNGSLQEDSNYEVMQFQFTDEKEADSFCGELDEQFDIESCKEGKVVTVKSKELLKL